MEGKRREINKIIKRGRRKEWSRKEEGRKEINKGVRKKERRDE